MSLLTYDSGLYGVYSWALDSDSLVWSPCNTVVRDTGLQGNVEGEEGGFTPASLWL